MSKELWGYRSEICDDECIENCDECRKGKELVAVKMAMQGYVKKADVIKLSKCTWRKDCTCCDFATDGDSWCEGQLFAVNVLYLPSADVVERKHGKWIEHKNAEEAYGFLISNYECTCCHDWLRDITRYCPSCGADMRGE